MLFGDNAKIIDDLIIIPNFSEETLFDKIELFYNRKLKEGDFECYLLKKGEPYKPGAWFGVENFILFRKTLVFEKEVFGFQTMAKRYRNVLKNQNEIYNQGITS